MREWLIENVPAWVSTLAGLLVGGGVKLAAGGGDDDAWLAALLLLALGWFPMLGRLAVVNRERSTPFLGILVVTLLIAQLSVFDDVVVRVAFDMIVLAPSAYWLIDRPYRRPAAR
jgi:hypothetical protein